MELVKSDMNGYIGAIAKAYYKFSTGGLGTDSSGNSHTLSLLADPFNKSFLHFDGADASTTFTDVSGKTWTAAGNAQIDTAQKQFGTASGLFDGAGDYITTPDHADWCTDAGDFTIDFWFRLPSLPGAYQAICGNRTAAGTEDGWVWWVDDANKIRFVWYKDDDSSHTVITDAAVTATTWHHVAAIRYQNTLKLYLNGTAQASTIDLTAHTNRDSSGAFAIGRQGAYANYYYNGWIDEFRYSKGIARWTANFTPFAEAYTGFPLVRTAGKFDQSAELLTEAGAFSAADHADFKPTGSFSISAWVKTTGAAGADVIFASFAAGTSKYAGFTLYMGSGTLRMLSGKNTGTVENTDWVYVNGATAINDGNWHFIVGTWDGAALRVYVDGKLDCTPKTWANAPAYQATNYVRVACENDTGTDIQFWEGSIDDLALWNGKALGADEVWSLYEDYTSAGFLLNFV